MRVNYLFLKNSVSIIYFGSELVKFKNLQKMK